MFADTHDPGMYGFGLACFVLERVGSCSLGSKHLELRAVELQEFY